MQQESKETGTNKAKHEFFTSLWKDLQKNGNLSKKEPYISQILINR